MVVETSRSPLPSRRAEELELGTFSGRCVVRDGHVAPERLAALLQVLHLRAVLGRLVERRLVDLVVGDRDIEAVAERRSSSSSIFFCWWVMFWPSPASPMP